MELQNRFSFNFMLRRCSLTLIQTSQPDLCHSNIEIRVLQYPLHWSVLEDFSWYRILQLTYYQELADHSYPSAAMLSSL